MYMKYSNKFHYLGSPNHHVADLHQTEEFLNTTPYRLENLFHKCC